MKPKESFLNTLFWLDFGNGDVGYVYLTTKHIILIDPSPTKKPLRAHKKGSFSYTQYLNHLSGRKRIPWIQETKHVSIKDLLSHKSSIVRTWAQMELNTYHIEHPDKASEHIYRSPHE